jgi:hypothetical protein
LAWVAVRLKTPNEKTDEELSQILVATKNTDDNSLGVFDRAQLIFSSDVLPRMTTHQELA